MYHPLPDFPPLFPKAGWWRAYLSGLLAGKLPEEAVRMANSSLKARYWMRFDGLSVPVEGGASALKNRAPHTWRISDRAYPEARKIDHTLATRYGHTPFYRLLDHEISLRSILEGKTTAEEVCRDAFLRVARILGLDSESLLDSARDYVATGTDKRESGGVPPEYGDEDCILAPLFSKGPETIFLLLPTFKCNVTDE